MQSDNTAMPARPTLTILLAAPDCRHGYQSALLDHADRQRLKRSPALAERADWQSSRYLKQQTQQLLLSLSHSRGAAALAASDSALSVGIDIEYMQPRHFSALSAYSCNPQEQQWLAQRGWQAADYYRLWTLKEALLKAGRLDFPADLPQVGAVWPTAEQMALSDCANRSWRGLSAYYGNWALSCVWDAACAPHIEWRLFGGSDNAEQLSLYGLQHL